MTNRNPLFMAMVALSILFLSCKSSTEPVPPIFIARQVSGCNGSPGGLVAGDSCFSYQFHDALILDFCVTGNCCPDSNRFSFTHTVSRDTILVVVRDTAANLCRCTCSYLLRAELRNLDRDEYLVLCASEDDTSRFILYSERVRRS